jgi:hypothetical protein
LAAEEEVLALGPVTPSLLRLRRTIARLIHSDSDPFALLPRYPALPAWLVAPSGWRVLRAGRFRDAESITILEGRAALMALERMLRERAPSPAKGFGRVLVLVDNQGVVGAFNKGRSPRFDLRRLCERLLALSVVGGFTARFRYIITVVNPADEPSRRRRHSC